MRLNLSGHPLHTRLQTIEMQLTESGAVVADGQHLDLRKRGFVPVGADLQGSGIIHQMNVRASIDPVRARLLSLESAMPVVAFEPSALTGGESCRDLAGRVAGMENVSLTDGYARSVSGSMGGVRGCSHVLSLTQHLGSAVHHGLELARAKGVDWSSGEPRRLFHRSLTIDGAEPEPGTIELAAQLSDLYFRPAPKVGNPMDRFVYQEELRVLVRVEMKGITVTSLDTAWRRRGRDDLDTVRWQRGEPAVADLEGVRLIGGFAAEVLQRWSPSAENRPLLDVLLALAPTFIQVCACFSETWPGRAMATDTLVGVGGVPDACFMWRRDGALHARKKPTDPNATL